MTTTTNSYAQRFSLAGGGWMMVYEFGVAKALGQFDVHREAQMIGVSAGSLTAIGLALTDGDFDVTMQALRTKYIPEAHASLTGPFKMRKYLVDALLSHSKLDRYEILNGGRGDRVTVVYSSLSAWTSRRVSQFDSKETLLWTLVASCCATPLVGLPFKLHGEWVADGVLFDPEPEFDEPSELPTTRISPMFHATHADIKPSRYVHPWWYVYPPSISDMQWVYDLGYYDGLRWLQAQGYAVDASLLVDPGVLTWKTALGATIGYRTIDETWFTIILRVKASLYTLVWLLLHLELSLLFGVRCLRDHKPIGLSVTALTASSATLTTLVSGRSASLWSLSSLVIALILAGVVLITMIVALGSRLAATSAYASTWQRHYTCLVALRDAAWEHLLHHDDHHPPAVSSPSRSSKSSRTFLRSLRQRLEDEHHNVLWEISMIYRWVVHQDIMAD